MINLIPDKQQTYAVQVNVTKQMLQQQMKDL